MEAKKAITKELVNRGIAREVNNYKMRDWICACQKGNLAGKHCGKPGCYGIKTAVEGMLYGLDFFCYTIIEYGLAARISQGKGKEDGRTADV